MRLWSIHPKYLDHKRLVAVWREGLLAQKVLAGQTKGYKNHPQLDRFRDSALIGSYLHLIEYEASKRGYRFNCDLISTPPGLGKIPVTVNQLRYEYRHLLNKLDKNSEHYKNLILNIYIDQHPIFVVVPGEIESWEKVSETVVA